MRDKELLENLTYTLYCGRLVNKGTYGEFVVEKFSDICNKVIPIFDQFKLYGSKSHNYEYFKKAALLIKDKAHLTENGLNQIKELKDRNNFLNNYLQASNLVKDL